jgi:hypothetical protein
MSSNEMAIVGGVPKIGVREYFSMEHRDVPSQCGALIQPPIFGQRG